LPTRLLDWTYSPFVALHFATADLAQFDRDSFVWCLDYVGAAALLPQRLCDVLEEEGAQVFTTEMLDGMAPTLQSFDALQAEPFMLFFEPPALNDRIVNQHGLFSIASGAGVRPEAWIAQHPTLARCIVIPASLKWEVRDKLDQANITERVLFPGLDGLSAWLTRYYLPRPRDGNADQLTQVRDRSWPRDRPQARRSRSSERSSLRVRCPNVSDETS